MSRVAILLAALAVLHGEALGQPRVMLSTRDGQQYLAWRKDPGRGYYFSEYQLKSNPRGNFDHTQYVIYKPSVNNQWVYWYNQKTRKFWARCPTKNHPTFGKAIARGKDIWAVLPQNQRPNTIDAAMRAEYPEAKEMRPPVFGADMRRGDMRTIPCLPPGLPD